MRMTTVEGIVHNGQIELPAHVHLPEEATVYVLIPDATEQNVPLVASPRLVDPEQAKHFAKQVMLEKGNDSL